MTFPGARRAHWKSILKEQTGVSFPTAAQAMITWLSLSGESQAGNSGVKPKGYKGLKHWDWCFSGEESPSNGCAHLVGILA